jgi:outer membrane protein assembly factor BamE (lipoprotein component of BamABCDE complex)
MRVNQESQGLVKFVLKVALAVWIATALSGCMTAAEHRAGVQDDSSERLTVGTVQREIRVGMSGAQVIEVLGSPNVVTTDEKRREVWVYDKISTDRVESGSSGGVNILVLFAQSSAGATSTSQRTLTVIIKFDEQNKVRDFAYHTSRF